MFEDFLSGATDIGFLLFSATENFLERMYFVVKGANFQKNMEQMTQGPDAQRSPPNLPGRLVLCGHTPSSSVGEVQRAGNFGQLGPWISPQVA